MIGSVVHRGSFLIVADEQGRHLSTIGVGERDKLQGYTGSTIAVQKGSFIHTYDEHGRKIGTVAAR